MNDVEGETVVDDHRGLCDNRRFSVRRSVVVQQRWDLGQTSLISGGFGRKIGAPMEGDRV